MITSKPSQKAINIWKNISNILINTGTVLEKIIDQFEEMKHMKGNCILWILVKTGRIKTDWFEQIKNNNSTTIWKMEIRHDKHKEVQLN